MAEIPHDRPSLLPTICNVRQGGLTATLKKHGVCGKMFLPYGRADIEIWDCEAQKSPNQILTLSSPMLCLFIRMMTCGPHRNVSGEVSGEGSEFPVRIQSKQAVQIQQLASFRKLRQTSPSRTPKCYWAFLPSEPLVSLAVTAPHAPKSRLSRLLTSNLLMCSQMTGFSLHHGLCIHAEGPSPLVPVYRTQSESPRDYLQTSV